MNFQQIDALQWVLTSFDHFACCQLGNDQLDIFSWPKHAFNLQQSVENNSQTSRFPREDMQIAIRRGTQIHCDHILNPTQQLALVIAAVSVRCLLGKSFVCTHKEERRFWITKSYKHCNFRFHLQIQGKRNGKGGF